MPRAARPLALAMAVSVALLGIAPSLTGDAAASSPAVARPMDESQPLACVATETENDYANGTNYGITSTEPAPTPFDTCSLSRSGDSVTVTVQMTMPVSPACPEGSPNGPVPNPRCSAYTDISTSYSHDANDPPLSCPFSPPGSPEAQSTEFENYWQELNGRTSYVCTDTFSLAQQAGRDFVLTGYEVVWAASGNVSTAASSGETDYLDTFTVPLSPPVASFTVAHDASSALAYDFDGSGSYATDGSLTSYAWDFGDGSSATTTTPKTTHTYGQAGSYTVRLTVTDTQGVTGSTTRSLAGDLTVDITVSAPDGSPLTGGDNAPGQSLLATVTLTASTSASAALTDVTASPPLSWSPQAKLVEQSASGPPAGGYTIKPGESVSYTVSLMIAGLGKATLSVTAAGHEQVDGEDSAPQASATKTVLLGSPLQIDVAWQHADGSPLALTRPGQQPLADTVKLADTDAGETPQDVVAVVTVTNISPQPQTHVTVNGLPALSYHRAADARQGLPLAITSGPTGPVTDLAVGASTTLTYGVHVTNNGVFDLTPQLLSSDSDDTNAVSQGVGTVTALPTALLWVALKQRDTRSIRAGDVRYLTGTVTNRSLTQSLDVVPLEPSTATGNAGGGAMTDVTQAPYADGTVPPFSGLLKPGQTVDLEGQVDTAFIPATRAVLTYQPAGLVINPDTTEDALTADQVGMTAASSPINVQVNDADPDVPPITVEAAFDSFTDGAVQGAGTWAVGHLRAAATLLAHPIDGAAAAVAGVAKVVVHTPRDLASAAYIVSMSEVYATAYLALSPAQRASFENQILADYDQSYVKADNAEAGKAIQEGFASFAVAQQTGDFRTVAKLAGSGLATGGGAVADAVLSDVFFQQLGIGLKGLAKGAARGRLANALVLADEAVQKKLPAAAYREVTAVKVGQNLLLKGGEALENVFGMTKDQIANLRAYCKENKLIIAVRARSKRAADLIRRGLAVGKNEVLKLKGVNEIDVDYLGYAKSDLNTLVFAEPVPKAEVIAELDRRGITGNDRDVVLERYEQRKKEWTDPKVAGVMDKANATGEIEWGFNGTDNAASEADRSAQRRFALHDKRGATMLDGKTPRKYQTVYVSNVEGTVGGRLVRVTQDTDMLAILSENGQILSAKLRTQAYTYLSDVLGIEHPETISWISKGDILFLTKIKELLRTAKGGGEALAVFGADGSARAGFLNPALTVYDVAEKTGVVFFEGGYNNPYAKAATSLLVKLKRFAG